MTRRQEAAIAVGAIALGAVALVLPVPVRAVFALVAGLLIPCLVLAAGLRRDMLRDIAGAVGVAGGLVLAYWCLATFLVLLVGGSLSRVESLGLLALLNVLCLIAVMRRPSGQSTA
jgi:uncharacterized membrane protein